MAEQLFCPFNRSEELLIISSLGALLTFLESMGSVGVSAGAVVSDATRTDTWLQAPKSPTSTRGLNKYQLNRLQRFCAQQWCSHGVLRGFVLVTAERRLRLVDFRGKTSSHAWNEHNVVRQA